MFCSCFVSIEIYKLVCLYSYIDALFISAFLVLGSFTVFGVCIGTLLVACIAVVLFPLKFIN